MSTPPRVVSRYTDEQSRILNAAKKSIKSVAGMLDWDVGYEDLVLNRQAMTYMTADVVKKYGMAASANAAELFEAVDEARTGAFKLAEMADDVAFSEVEAAVHFAAGSLFPGDGMPPDVDAFVERVCGSVVRMVNNQAMQTMAVNDVEYVTYRRVVVGDHVCPLCEELAERGAVWSVDELVQPHDGCMCQLIPETNAIKATPGEVYPEINDLF